MKWIIWEDIPRYNNEKIATVDILMLIYAYEKRDFEVFNSQNVVWHKTNWKEMKAVLFVERTCFENLGSSNDTFK